MASSGRLVVKSLCLVNFKSYSGENVIGPFHKGFNAILGPNGNGKSNVIDALLFVFGKRSRKLRTKRLAELIHKSAVHQTATYAKVTVHFEAIVDKDGDEFEVIIGSEFSVSRLVYSNSRSEYLINEGKVSFNQVAFHLRDKGFDIENNRFLILQGEVELIAQLKAKGSSLNETGLLEYLEDIIGSDKYTHDIHRLSEELENATIQRDTMQRRIRAVEQETKALESGKGEAEVYLKRKAEILTMKIQRNTHSILQLKTREMELMRTMKGTEDQVKELTPMLIELRDKLVKQSAAARSMEVKCEQINQQLDILTKDISSAECQDIQSKTELNHLENELNKLSDKQQKLEREIELCFSEATEAEQEISRLQTAIVAMKNNHKSQEERLKSLEDEHAPELAALDNELTNARLLTAPFRNKLAEIEGATNIKKSEHEIFTNKSLQFQKEAEEIQEQINSSNSALNDKTNEIKTLQEEIKTQEKSLHEIQILINKNEKSFEKVETQFEKSKSVLLTAKNTTKSLMHQTEAMSLLLQAKTSDSIPGIIGRLGDLAFTDPMYDIAISSCCPALDYIVVESIEDAEAAGELLNRHQLQPLTFLILSKQQHLEKELLTPFQAPEQSLRLFDVLQIQDKRLRVAFYFALRNTLVTESLEVATKIAFRNRMNVVTLNGELCSDSGAMTGGGKPLKGRMRLGQSSTMNQVVNLTDSKALEEEASANFNKLKEELNERKEQIEKQKTEAAKLKESVECKVGEIRMKKMEIDSQKRSIMRLQHALEEKQNQAKGRPEDSLKLGALEMEISALEQEWFHVNEEAKACFQQVEEVESKISRVAHGAITQLKNMIQKIKQEISSNESRIVQCQCTINNMPKKKTKLEQTRDEFSSQQQLITAQISQKKEELAIREKETASLKASRSDLKKAHDKANIERRGINDQVNSIKQQINEYSEREEAMKTPLEEAKNSLDAEVTKRQNLEANIERYKKEFMECLQNEDAPSFEEEDVRSLDTRELNYRMEESTKELDSMEVNLDVVYQYQEKKKELETRTNQYESCVQQRNQVMANYEQLKTRRLNEFLTGFQQIRIQLKKVYRMITNGGDADLDLIDSLDPFCEGVEFSVRPPAKSWKKIANLSGGEKTLSSLALIFALHYYKPTMIYVMDEIDAALDFRNVAITAEYIAKRTGNAQFIVVSVRSEMFDRVSRMVGTTRSKIVKYSHSQSNNLFS
eukprot:g932.t1